MCLANCDEYRAAFLNELQVVHSGQDEREPHQREHDPIAAAINREADSLLSGLCRDAVALRLPALAHTETNAEHAKLFRTAARLVLPTLAVLE